MKRIILLFSLVIMGCGNQTLPTIGHSLPSSPQNPILDPKAAAKCIQAKGVAEGWKSSHAEISKTSALTLPDGTCEVAIQVAANADLVSLYNLIEAQSGMARAIKISQGFVGVWFNQNELASDNKSKAAPALGTTADCAAAKGSVQSEFPQATLNVVNLKGRLLFNSACYLQAEFSDEDLQSFLKTPRSTYALNGELLLANVVHKDGSVATVHLHVLNRPRGQN